MEKQGISDIIKASQKITKDIASYNEIIERLNDLDTRLTDIESALNSIGLEKYKKAKSRIEELEDQLREANEQAELNLQETPD